MPSSFDDKAATWDDPAKIDRAREVAGSIANAVSLDRSTRLLEYGAGTGLVSEQLAPSVGPITLADPSEGMRQVAQAKVESGALPDTTRVWGLDLTSEAVPEDRFDLIVTVMTLHHIADLATVLAGFATLLDDEGRLCIIDLEEEDGSFHAAGDGEEAGSHHAHDGFSAAALTKLLGEAGFTTRFEHSIHDVTKNDRPYPLFLATCSKK